MNGLFDPVQRSAAVQQAFDNLGKQLDFTPQVPINMESPDALRAEVQKAMDNGDYQKANFYQQRLKEIQAKRDQLTPIETLARTQRNQFNTPRTEEEQMAYDLKKAQLEKEKTNQQIKQMQLQDKQAADMANQIPIDASVDFETFQQQVGKIQNPKVREAVTSRYMKSRKTYLELRKKVADIEKTKSERQTWTPLEEKDFVTVYGEGYDYKKYLAAAQMGKSYANTYLNNQAKVIAREAKANQYSEATARTMAAAAAKDLVKPGSWFGDFGTTDPTSEEEKTKYVAGFMESYKMNPEGPPSLWDKAGRAASGAVSSGDGWSIGEQ